jgi:SAM-dependent methyltransferase
MAVQSKAFQWGSLDSSGWDTVSDEFLPVALRWRDAGVSRILDLGCGIGRHALFLAGLGLELTAVDLSPEGIAELERRSVAGGLSARIRTLVCDMLELPFGDAEFGAVLAYHSIYHTDMAGLESVIRKIHAILEPRGRLFVTFNSKSNPGYDDPANRIVDEHTRVKTRGVEAGIPHTFVDRESLRGLLAGFRIQRVRHIQEFWDIDSPDEGWGWHYFVEAERAVSPASS